jgi:hypothetical protein
MASCYGPSSFRNEGAMEYMQWLLQILRDPAWGAIGVLISIPLAFLAGKQSQSETLDRQEKPITGDNGPQSLP